MPTMPWDMLRRALGRKASPAAPAVAFAFVADPPATVGALAAALRVDVAALAGDEPTMGMLPTPFAPAARAPLSDDVRSLFVRYEWDMYHEHRVTPERLPSRRLESYTVHLARGRAACEAALRAAHGPPASVARDGAPLRRYGPFFVDAAGGDAVALEWHATEPDWAKPPADEPGRAAALAELAERLRRAGDDAALDAALAALPAVTGLRRDERSLVLEPPMPALAVAAALGAPDAIACTVGVHMAQWVLARTAGDRPAPLVLGEWEVEAALDGRATGGDVPGVSMPAAAVAGLGPGDRVYAVHLRSAAGGG